MKTDWVPLHFWNSVEDKQSNAETPEVTRESRNPCLPLNVPLPSLKMLPVRSTGTPACPVDVMLPKIHQSEKGMSQVTLICSAVSRRNIISWKKWDGNGLQATAERPLDTDGSVVVDKASQVLWSRTQSLLGLGKTNCQVPVLSSGYWREKEIQTPPGELLFWATHIPKTFQMDQELEAGKLSGNKT